MLKRLDIENLVLLQKAHLNFDAGFTIITGETGSGKTILLQALRYVTGERADAEAVRAGAAKAVIEAEFEPAKRGLIETCLEEAGIEWEPNSPLLLKREISREGRNRAFINCQMVTLSLLQKIGDQLIDFTDQHAHHELRKPPKQRLLIDLFGSLIPLVQESKNTREVLKQIDERLDSLRQSAAAKDKELEKIQMAIEEISSANLKTQEEEIVSSEHHRLAHAQELTEKTSQLIHLLENPPFALIVQSRKTQTLLQQIATIDSSLESLVTISQEITLNLQELHRSLSSYLSQVEADPKRLEYLEERLSLLDKLKRRYGNPLAHLQELKQQEHKLCSYEEEIEALEQEREKAAKIASISAEKRFAARKQTSILLEQKTTEILRDLNMPFAKFSIELTYSFSEDEIAFLLQANPGQPGGAIQEFASGGELSRLMIALQSALAEKHPTPTIVFDEIDANIGGETATIIGKTFQRLGIQRQVLAITHFPQVASQADHHFLIGKQLSESGTLTTVEALQKDWRAKELLRMLGGRQPILQQP